ncbi:HAD-IC family P-type ATPase [Flavihumibacter rivuli]|uniref:cation-translocating P-type ATPase n=1 Tax=Flavihumibacter rivuli TaxID=2838156 RepID=UPI001BDF1A82|nr:HAD-IC family P-type ATPase [Flavihumibacter rivuli]ULQ57509.1 HAD-IC family P-type ATPase [Flavihumibacter rivuli]
MNYTEPWEMHDKGKVMDLLHSPGYGLSTIEVAERRKVYGWNILPEPRGKSLLGIFFSQFLNPLIYVLIAAGLVSFWAGDKSDALFILVIIVINALLGTWQEFKAESSAKSLRKMVKAHARVFRDGSLTEVGAPELVPGDLVCLESGMRVPADIRLFEVKELLIEEALLTGESMPVEKHCVQMHQVGLPLGDQVNMAFAATTVLKGRATGMVVRTGTHTEIGKIAASLTQTEQEKPPLLARMDIFSRKISIAVVVICVLLGIIGWLRGMAAYDIFFFMVAVGVSAIPEGLPVALTVALSIGTSRMARRNVIVRRLPAVEGLGSCTLIASDKTGTLTMDQQSVKLIYLPDGRRLGISGQGYNGDGYVINEQGDLLDHEDDLLFELVKAAVLSNEGVLKKTRDGWEHSGDAVDVALRSLAYKLGKDPEYFTREVDIIRMVPYESENKYSGVYYQYRDQYYFAMKGAVETVSKYLSGTGQQIAFEESEGMAAAGYRVLALASGQVDSFETENLPELDLLGLTGLIDPLREEAVPAIRECREAGIEVAMVTGDHPATALAIAKRLGIAENDDQVITGKELAVLENASPAEFSAVLASKTVFARVTPLQKKVIIDGKKQLGHFVAVTGDGANDAPALKSAHIGIAMGAGTDLAKDAASIIVTDNNFASIAAGVEEGRFTYDNLRKIIYLLISTGLAEILLVALPIILGMPLPFLAVQLLWLNLVTNGIQDIALAFEKGDMAVMKKPPRRPTESIFDKQMNVQISVAALIMTLVTFGCWWLLINHFGYGEKHARSVLMMLMVLLQNFHVLNCRSETISFLKTPVKNNWTILIGISLAQLVHIGAAYLPGISKVLQLEPIALREWLVLLPAALTILLGMEVYKYIRNMSEKKIPSEKDGTNFFRDE